MFTFENCPFPLKKATDISNDKREEKAESCRKFWDFQKSSDYILAYQRSIVHKLFLKVPEFFHTKKENEAINMNKKKILYAYQRDE